MVSHKFALGDRVRLNLERYAESNPRDIHTISRKLPAEANVCQYRVKRVGDGQERTVNENQIVKADGDFARTPVKEMEVQQRPQRTRTAVTRAGTDRR